MQLLNFFKSLETIAFKHIKKEDKVDQAVNLLIALDRGNPQSTVLLFEALAEYMKRFHGKHGGKKHA